MIKVFALIPKRADIGDEQFHEHWRNPHGELAKRITTLRRYVQSHATDERVDGLPPAIYRGVAEVWFDSLEVALGMGSDPNYVDYAGADEPNFIDQSRLAFLFTEERVVVAGPELTADAPETKAIILLRRRAGVAPEEFRKQLQDAADGLAGPAGLQRAVVCTSLPDMYTDGDPPFDAVVELSWPDAASFRRAWGSRDDAGQRLAALLDLPDPVASAALLTEPYRVIWP